jgi:multidrug efflux pump subunit AcrB
MMYMSSQCTNDGTYNLMVTFKLGTDSNMAQVLVQNRVSLALPVIPALVQREGINVRKMSPSTLMIVNLISPDGRYSDVYLSNYATIEISDELGRLPGVAGIGYLGQRNYSLRSWLDPDRMASLQLTATDVANAISTQNLQVAAGQIGQEPAPKGQQFQLPINTLGRLSEPEQFADIILKVGPGPSGQAAGTNGQGGNGGSSASPTAGASGQAAQNVSLAQATRSSTTSPAPSTASRRWRCRSTSCPAPTRCKPRRASTTRWRS